MLRYVVGVVLFGLITANIGFSQNAQLGGIATDTSGALLPGVTINATNTETGVLTSTLTNESGAYSFPSIQPGKSYSLSASLSGFQTKTFTNVELGTTSVRQNFQLQVSTAQTSVVISAEGVNAISANSASIGDVLSQDRITNLPLVGNNVLSLINVLPGLRVSLGGTQLDTVGGLGLNTMNITRDGLTTNDTRFGAEGDLAAGTPIPNFGGLGVMSPTTINPDLVGEIRLILSPVDAELGRGNSQIQIQTRSGTNKYTGSAVWNIQNTALNANTWGNNRQVDPRTGLWAPLAPDWRNVNQYTISLGGPIVKNKTFFFVLWDQNISALRATMNNRVLTKEARNGIVRFWEGWVADSGDSINNPTSYPTAAANPTIASVDFAGKPLTPQFWPDGTPYTGRLVCYSIYGTTKLDGSAFGAGDCPSGVDSSGRAYTAVAMTPPGGSLWDNKRPGGFNNAGYFAKVLAAMPLPNNFIDDNGDGLVSGVYRYLLTRRTGDPTFYNETLVGNDPYSNRKQINIKIDQNFKSHRISAGWTHQMDDNVVFRGEWQDGFGGNSYRRPHIFTFNVTSTLSSTLVNEGRFGLNINKAGQDPPWLSQDQSLRDQAQKYLGAGGTRPGGTTPYPAIVRAVSGCPAGGFPGETTLAFDNGPMTTRLNCAIVVPNYLNDPLYEVVDTLSWAHGKHALKFGGDFRFPRTDGYAFQPYIDAPFGNLGGATTQSPFATDTAGTGTPSLGATQLATGQTYATNPNIYRGDSRTIATNLTYLLTDSIGSLNTPYWIESQADKDKGIPGWQDITTKGNRTRSTVSSDFSLFAKDDFKFSKNLTLNLGLRYEYYSPPYLKSGLTATIADLGNGLFGAGQGAGGQQFDNWLQPGNLYLTNYGNAATLAGASPLECKSGVQQSALLPLSTCNPNSATNVEFVGPGTTNPDKGIMPRDRNNFGPAVGFAWQVPWFGEGKTTVRGGYSVQFSRVTVLEQTLASAPGNTLNQVAAAGDADVLAIAATRAINYSDLATLVPRLPAVAPGAPTPIYARNISTSAYAADLATPYTQNLTLSVTRNIRRDMTLDVRYVGTLARKQPGNIDLNASTVMYNPELFNALEVTRKGGNDPLFDQMFMGIRLSGVPATVPVVNGTTSTGSDQLRQSSALGPNFLTLNTNLANGNYVAVANTLITSTIAAGGQGITGLSPGPAFAILHNGCDRIANGLSALTTRCFPENYLTANPQLNAASYLGNFGRSNYHALQVQYSVRPVQGISIQSTYSWSKSMQLAGTGYTDPLNRDFDHVRGLDNLHNFRMNGTIELPFGPNKLLFANTSGWVARAIEKWQTSLILNVATGQPSSIGGAGTTRYGNPSYVVASPLWKVPEGQAKWDGPGGNTGTFYGTTYVTQRDPQCTNTALVAASLSGFCTLNALAMRVDAGTPGSFLLNDGTSAVTALVNPKPGEYGTFGGRQLDSWGQYFLDANISKSFRISESKSLSIRVDSTNILNHPQLATPNFTVGGTAFGQIATKGNAIFGGGPVQRTFQGQLRLTF